MKLQAMKGKVYSWPEYVDVLHAHFGDELFGDPILEMKHLKQEGSVADYQRRFDTLLNRVQLLERISERAAVSQFIGGLDNMLQGSVRIQRP